MNDDETVLKADEVAELLRCDRKTVYLMVQREAIPHRHVGRSIRFSKAAVLEWLRSTQVCAPNKRR